MQGTADEARGTYSFSFEKSGHGTGELFMFALPHHLASFDEETNQRVQKVQLQTTTKGIASLVKGTKWTMVEPKMPISMGFAPWDPEKGNMTNLSDRAKSLIHAAASKEISQNMVAQSNIDSMYFGGKVKGIWNGRKEWNLQALTLCRHWQNLLRSSWQSTILSVILPWHRLG